MFSKENLKSIDQNYFTVTFAGCFCIALQSKNTHHCWQISHEDYGSFQTCSIYHTHRKGTPPHLHGHGRNLESCIAQIKSHDEYQLKKDAHKRELSRKRRNTFFQNPDHITI